MGDDAKALTPERSELRNAGLFYTAKLIVLRNIYRGKKGLPTDEEERCLHEQQ